MNFQITEIIRKKRDGQALSEQELSFLVRGYVDGSLQDYHMSAWLMAVYFQGMTAEEMRTWARLMWRSGITLPRESGKGDFWIDKHSTGGVGDKTSLILVPLVHCVARKYFGEHSVRIPMISGRGLGFSGGTLDKLDSVPGFSSNLSLSDAMKLLLEKDFFMLGQTSDLAPADRLLYSLRDVTATVECIPLIVSSILSKKLAENLNAIVFDVKYGDGAFMADASRARLLAKNLTEVARAEGVSATALLANMEEPLGWKVGNQLEVEECADYLAGIDREAGLHEVTLALAAEMLVLASRGKWTALQAKQACEESLATKAPFEVFISLFENQGGAWKSFQTARERLKARPRVPFLATQTGFVESLSARAVGKLVHALGGGRQAKEKGINPDVGVVLHKKIGDPVKKGEAVFEVVLSAEVEKENVPDSGEAFFKVSQFPVDKTQWVKEVMHAG